MGRPRQRAGGGGTVRWLVSAFLRKHGLNGANPRDRSVQKQRMVVVVVVLLLLLLLLLIGD